MVLIISIVLLSVVGIIILIDIIPIFNDWFSRVHIGRYYDQNIWKESVTNIGVKWLRKTPKIKVTDNTRFVLIDILKRNYTKAAVQHWQEASLLLGLTEYLKYNVDIETRNEIIKFLSGKFDEDGQWLKKPNYVDSAILAYAIMKLDFINVDRYKNAFDYTWELIKDHIGEDGTVGYRKSMRNYRYIDTIGFICPFLIVYGIRYNKIECVDLAVKQIKEYEKFGMLQNHGIPCHAYKIDNKAPLGLYGWGRGLGWFAIGLIDAWNELPPGHEYKTELEKIIKKYAKACIGFQQENGCWNWTVTRDESRADSSSTATLGWFMVNASKISEISQDCINSTNKAISYLMKATRRNGAVDFSQGDTKDIGVYSLLFNILPFTQGFSIRLINKYNNSKVV